MKSRAASPILAPKRLAIAVAGCFCLGPVLANPVGPQLQSGSAAFAAQGSTLTISNSPGAIINWQGFSIGAGETTRFNQASAASSVLNRVVTNNPSQLLGSLQSNGRVFLINPAGILVGAGAVVDTAGLVASTLNLSNADFLAGRFNFTATPGAGKVENYGSIGTSNGGSVYLVGAQVENHGIINAPNGDVLLAAGKTAQLIDTATPGVRVEITADDEQALNLGQILAASGRVGMVGAIVRNSGRISASSVSSEGGRVFLKASADAYVDQGASIEATGTQGGRIEVLGNRVALTDQARIDASGTQGGGSILVGGDYQGSNAAVQNARISYVGEQVSLKADAIDQGKGGKVVVWADSDTVVAGRISAKGGAQGGDGGFVETSGKASVDFSGVRVDASAENGKAGNWLIDPSWNLVITGSGASSLAAALDGGGASGTNVEVLETSSSYGTSSSGGAGNITVGSGISWGKSSVLTLTAANSIDIASSIAGSAGGLVLNAGSGGITQTAAITASTLGITSSGNVALDTSSNQVGTARGSVTGPESYFHYRNAGSFTVGGVTTAGGDITILGSDIGAMNITGNVNAGAGAVSIRQTWDGLTGSSNIETNSEALINGASVELRTSNSASKITGSGAVISTGDLTLQTGGAEISPGKLTVTGVTTVNAGTGDVRGDILLTNVGNSFGGAVNATGGAISIYAASALNFATLSYGSNKAVDLRTSVGNLTLPGAIDTGSANLTLKSAGTLSTAGALTGADVSLSAGGTLSLEHAVTATNLTLTSTAADISKTAGAITVSGTLTASAATGIDLGEEGNRAATVSLVNSTSGHVQYTGTGISSDSGLGPTTFSGSNVGPGSFTVSAANAVRLGLISNPGGQVSVTSGGAIVDANGSSNNIAAASAILKATYGIGADDAIETRVSSLNVWSTGEGSVEISNTGALTTTRVSAAGGNVSVTTHSPLTIAGTGVSASGNVTLTAGNSGTGATGDDLTINAPITTSGSITLTAGNNITGTNVPTGANVSLSPNGNPAAPAPAPTIAQCVATPTFAGCATVLPTLAACTTTPTAPGCSVVLPTLAVCTVTPTTAGCSAVLPTIAVCTTTPTAPGCSAVLPSLASCAANPAAAGCSAVLPTISVCTTTPTAPGCSVVLPTMAVCTVNPSAPGCSAVLPSLASCTANPAAAGCAVVLPSLASCLAMPTAPGCGVVLPSIAVCTTTPAAPGCSAVLPSLARCVATPAAPGCTVVLPTLAACTATPTLAGCTAVLPTLSVCAMNPTAPGCAVVTPRGSTPSVLQAQMAADQGYMVDGLRNSQSNAKASQPSSSYAPSPPRVVAPTPVGGIGSSGALQTYAGGVVGGEAPNTFGSAGSAAESGDSATGSSDPGNRKFAQCVVR